MVQLLTHRYTACMRVGVCVCAALTLIIPHHARQHATQLLNAALRPNEERKNVRGICLSHIRIHPTFIECVMGFSPCLPFSLSPPFSCSRLLASLASQFLFAFRFMIFALPPFCVTISLPVLQYIYVYVSHRIYRTYIYSIYRTRAEEKSFAWKAAKSFAFPHNHIQ